VNDNEMAKDKIQKRLKLDNQKLTEILRDCSLSEKESYTEEEFDTIRFYRKANPFSREDVLKRFKADTGLLNKLTERNLLIDKNFFQEKDLEILLSFQKLKRLGYNEEACLKVLEEVGVPKDENLAEDSRYIQLKDMAEQTGITERAIKFYEKDGLVDTPRIYKNKRFYESPALTQLEFIRDMQHVGYKLSEIKEILLLLKSGDNDVKSEAAEKLTAELNKKELILKDILNKVKEL